MPRDWLDKRSSYTGGVTSYSSRTLLHTATDDFGNIIDPGTGNVISQAGGQFAAVPPPWKRQSPITYNNTKHIDKVKSRHTDL